MAVPETESFQPIAETDRNPAHRRPWVKMRIEYDRTLIFTAFCEDLSNLGCMPFLWLNSIGKLAKWCFRLSETMILRDFGNDVTNWSLQGFASFFFIL